MADPHELTLEIAGKINLPEAGPLRPAGAYVYQRTAPGKGNIPADPAHALQLRRHVVPFDPQTPAQMARRAAFAAAVAAWQDLTPEQRETWRQPGKARNLSPFNAYLSATLKNQ